MADDFATAAGGGSQPEYEFEWQNPNRKPAFEVGRVVSSTFKAIMAHPAQFFILTFIGLGLPMGLFSLWPLLLGMDGGINMYDPNWIEDFEFEGLGGMIAIMVVIWLVMMTITMGAIIHMSVNALNQRRVDLGESFRVGLRHFFPILAIMILYYIGVMIGTLLLIIPGIFVALGWYLCWNVRVIEERSITDSLSRSWTLSKGYKRWLLLMMIIFGVIGAVISAIMQVPLLFLGNPQTAMFEGGSTGFWIANALVSAIAQMVVGALTYVGLTATYLEIRRVKEGVNSDSLADIFS